MNLSQMKPAFVLIGFFLGVLVANLTPVFMDSLIGYDRRMDSGYLRLEPGMTLAQVQESMGGAGEKLKEFHLGQKGGYELEYKAAARSGAAYFVRWRTGVDEFFTMGFDENDRLIFRARGRT